MPTVVTPRNESLAEILSFATGVLQGAEDRRRRDENIAIDTDRFDRRLGQDQTQFDESQNRADARQQSAQDYGRERDAADNQQQIDREQRIEAIADRRAVSERQARQDDLEFEYDFRARKEMERLNAATMDVMFDDRLNPEERDYALTQIEAQRRGIQPMPKIGGKQKYLKGQDIGDVWKDTYSGAVLTRDKDGTPKLLLKPEERPGLAMKFSDYVEVYSAVRESMRTERPSGRKDSAGNDEMEPVEADPADVESAVQGMLLGYQKLINGQKRSELEADMAGDEIDRAAAGGGSSSHNIMPKPQQLVSPKLGRSVTMQEIQATAQKRGLSIDQVFVLLGIDPRSIAGAGGQ